MKQKEEAFPAGEEIKQPDQGPEPEEVKAPEPDFLQQYRKCYPDVARFHVTGDHLVFLDRDYQQAVSHQQRCGKGELTTY